MSKARITLEINKRTRDLFDEVKTRVNATSVREVITRSMELYDVVSKAQERGASFTIKEADGKETTLLIL